MFEAYKVAVKLSLINNVSSGLLLLAGQFHTLNKQIGAVQGSVANLERQLLGLKRLGLIGGATAGVGFAGLGMIGAMVKPSMEYAHQLNIMNMAGLKHKELAEAVGDAWKNTGEIITTTATENLRSLLDLRNVLGNMDEARMALPIVSRIQAVLASSSGGQISGNSKELAYSMAKALDVIGAAQNKQMFERQAEMMAKVIIATQGRVTPEAFKSTMVYARQARYRLSDEFKYEILPSLIQENAASGGGGGGSRGVGPMLAAFYRFTNQGYVNKKSLEELKSLGLVDPSTALKTTTSGTTVGPLLGAELAAQNPFLWVQTVLVPALRRKYGNLSNDQLMAHVGEITRGNQLATSLIGEFAYKPVNFLRDQANIRGTMSTADAYKAAVSNDPNTAFKALHAQWENFKTAFTMGVVPVLIPALIKLTNAFNALGDWARKHPNLAKDLAVGFTALFGAMALGGVVLTTTAAFKALGLALGVGSASGGLAGTIRSVASAFGVLSKAGGVFLAAYAGWKAGGWLNDNVVNAGIQKLTGDKNQTLGGWIYDVTHKDSPYVAGAPGKSVQVTTKINVDGRKVAEAVSHHQAKAAGQPFAGTGAFDYGVAAPPVGMGYAR
jgi:hypothetical protein